MIIQTPYNIPSIVKTQTITYFLVQTVQTITLFMSSPQFLQQVLNGIGNDFRIDSLIASAEKHGNWYFAVETGADHVLIPHDDALSGDSKATQGIALEDVRSCIVNHEFRMKGIHVLLKGLDSQQVLVSGGGRLHTNVPADGSCSFTVIGVDMVVVAVESEDFGVIQVIPLVTVTLMRVKIHYHHPPHAHPRPQVVYCQRDIRVHAESPSLIETGMVEASGKIDGPSQFQSSTDGEDGSLSGDEHGVEYSPSEEEGGEDEERHLHVGAYTEGIAHLQQVAPTHSFQQQPPWCLSWEDGFSLPKQTPLEEDVVDVAVFLGVEGVALLDAAEGDVVVGTVDKAGPYLSRVLHLLPHPRQQVAYHFQQQRVQRDPERTYPAKICQVVPQSEGEGQDSEAEASSVYHPIHTQQQWQSSAQKDDIGVNHSTSINSPPARHQHQ